MIAFLLSASALMAGLQAQNEEKAPNTGAVKADLKKASSNMEIEFEYSTHDNSGEAGCETDGEFIYTALWNNNYFVKYTMKGQFVETFQIPGVERIRDMAYDGRYFYGSDASSMVYVMDFEAKLLKRTFTVPANVRGIAFNDADELFYACGWDTPITVFRKNGQVVETLPYVYTGSTYGLAYDKWSIGGPYLWEYTHGGSYANLLVKRALPSGSVVETYELFDQLGRTDYGELAGGLFLYPQRNGVYNVILAGNIQNDSLWALKLPHATTPVAPISTVLAFGIIGITFYIRRRKLF